MQALSKKKSNHVILVNTKGQSPLKFVTRLGGMKLMTPIKIAVYTIALNEESHVRRWYESAKDADLILIADTGSSDKTVTLAESLGIDVHKISVIPWRFDVARNASLALIPANFDICIQLDMDEVLNPGWRKTVEAAWRAGNRWPTYKHVTSRDTEGNARSFQHYFKIHPRKNFTWKYPIHEILTPTDGTRYMRHYIELEVDHIQDRSKSRKSYLNLLQQGVKEDPNDWRMAHYLNREYWYEKDWKNVINTAYSAMKLRVGWDVEGASTCMWASEAAIALGFPEWGMEWAKRGTNIAPNFYEAWHCRAHAAFLLSDWPECYESAIKIEALTRQTHHLVKPDVWEWRGYDLTALGAYNTNRYDEALTYGKKAFDANPNDERLKNNLNFYRKKEFQKSSISAKQFNPARNGLISLITPTRNRHVDIISQYERMIKQNHTNWEWLIFDDSDIEPNLGTITKDKRIKYIYTKKDKALKIGEKRNHLIEISTGQWIAHIDDDDLYTEQYLSTMLDFAVAQSVDLAFLNTWFFVDHQGELGRYTSNAVVPNQPLEGWGFTFFYKSELGRAVKFPNNNWEDHSWFNEVVRSRKFEGLNDESGLVFKKLHKSNTANFPWRFASREIDDNVSSIFFNRYSPSVTDKS